MITSFISELATLSKIYKSMKLTKGIYNCEQKVISAYEYLLLHSKIHHSIKEIKVKH